MIRKKTLEDIRVLIAPLLSDVTLSLIDLGAPIEKKDLAVDVRD